AALARLRHAVAVVGGRPMRTLEVSTLATPIGPLGLAAEDGVLIAVTFDGLPPLRTWVQRVLGPCACVDVEDPAGVSTPPRRFFAGDLDALASIPVRLHGTEFQRRAWEALRRIPVGSTWSYRRLAQEIGDPRATRAVGAANGQNPVPVIVPCHRVIGSD